MLTLVTFSDEAVSEGGCKWNIVINERHGEASVEERQCLHVVLLDEYLYTYRHAGTVSPATEVPVNLSF